MIVGGHAWLPGVCMVAGGVHGCRGHVWLRGGCIGYEEIRSMRRGTHPTGMHSC